MRGRAWASAAAVAALGLALGWQGFQRLRASRAGRGERGGDAVDEPRVTAAEMAREAGVNPNTFRAALRAANLSWHRDSEPWTVVRDSPEHQDMIRVLEELLSRRES